MINADTFTALDALWTELAEERDASSDRHADRLDGIIQLRQAGEITHEEAYRRVSLSRATMNDRLEFLGRWYVQKLSKELAAWMAA